jgi:hypothetical protein
MKKKMFVAVVMCIFLGGMSSLALGETVVVDDHFDDNVVTTNTTGIGSGFNFMDALSGSTVTEANSQVILNGPIHGGSRCSITSKEGAAIGSTISRFEFRSVSFAVGNTSTGGTARDCIGVKEGDAAWDYDAGLPTGFWVQFEGISLTTADGTGTWNGTSVLFYESSTNVKTVLATWTFDTLNWDSGTRNLEPALDITLDLDAEGYSLTIEGDMITLLSGSLSNTYAAAGITNELAAGYATAYIQSENPGINILIDQIIIKENAAPATGGPSNPVVTPDNGNGTIGDLVEVSTGVWQVQNVTLHFVAAGDPNELHEPQYKINPDIIQHNIYFQTGAPGDPNLYLYDSVAANIVDPYTDDPNVSYGPLPNGFLKQATFYKWQVEEVMDNGTGGYPAGDPNNIVGPVWSFLTGSATPAIITISAHQLTDTSGNAALTITTGTVANNFRWFKVVGQQDTEGGEADDVKLTDGGLYSTTTTKTLTITGMASNGSDDARYYAIAYNGDPEGVNVASAPSAVRWIWYPRETNRYTFEATYAVGSDIFVEDTIGSSDIQLTSDDGTLDVPSIDPANPAAPGLVGSNSLYFNNPNTDTDPNNADGQFGRISDTSFCAYKDITISAWIYHKGGGWQRILSVGSTDGSGTNGVNTMYFTPSGNNTSGALMLNVSGQSVTAPGGSVPENEWAYVTATLSGNVGKLFVNGEWVATNATLTNDPVANAPAGNIMLARSQWWVWDTLFNGYIADLRVWNYGLSTDEIAQTYMADNTNVAYVCESEIKDLPYDFNGNCIIDLGDFAMIAATWLDSDRIYPAP